jgi:hypothetical protein
VEFLGGKVQEHESQIVEYERSLAHLQEERLTIKNTMEVPIHSYSRVDGNEPNEKQSKK